MDFEKKVPEWDNVGAEPDAQLKKEGFKAGYKPPAAYFNWFFNRISEVAKELQEKAGNEIDNKPDASGGDISDTVITSAEEPKDDYPVPAAGDSTKVFLGKTRKFFGDIKNWMTGVCLLGQIVNNCVTDNAKLPLSAAQGKALMDLYNVLNTNQQKRPNLTVANVCLKGGGYGRTLCLDGNWFGKVSPAEKDCYYIALDANCKIYIGFQQHSASVITWS